MDLPLRLGSEAQLSQTEVTAGFEEHVRTELSPGECG